MTLDELEDLIENKINELKPEIKKRFVYRYTDEKSNSFATTQYFEPPMITFYLENILKVKDKPIDIFIKELLTHEIIHVIQPVFQEYKEGEATSKFQKLNFFK